MDIAYAELAEALETKEKLAQERANATAIRADGRVEASSVSGAIPWSRASWYLPAPANGSNVDAEFDFPQGATIRQVIVRAKTPPSGGQFRFQIDKGGGEPLSGALQAGIAFNPIPVNWQCDPGSVLRLNVLSVSGAAGCTIQILYGGLA